jgi:sulfate/thiosulfate-binding protein
MSIKFKSAAAVATIASLGVLAACGDSAEGSSGGGGGDEISIVGFSILEAANKDVTAAFQETDEGEGTTFTTSYGASGDQSRAVEAGLEADLVHFSLEPDMTRVVDAGAVADDWSSTDTKGIVSQSVVVFVVREGNPKDIQDWDDLVQEGVEIITPNPISSGGARWNTLAAWGQAIADGGTEADAEKYTTEFFEHAVALPESARDATTAFQSGNGDVLISYENEAILARQAGEAFDYVVPPTTLLIENPGAVTEDADPAAQDFLDFLVTPEAQEIYASYGFRPLGDVTGVEVEGANDPSDPFPAPETQLTITDDFNGWGEAAGKFFDEEEGIITKILAETGKG